MFNIFYTLFHIPTVCPDHGPLKCERFANSATTDDSDAQPSESNSDGDGTVSSTGSAINGQSARMAPSLMFVGVAIAAALTAGVAMVLGSRKASQEDKPTSSKMNGSVAQRLAYTSMSSAGVCTDKPLCGSAGDTDTVSSDPGVEMPLNREIATEENAVADGGSPSRQNLVEGSKKKPRWFAKFRGAA